MGGKKYEQLERGDKTPSQERLWNKNWFFRDTGERIRVMQWLWVLPFLKKKKLLYFSFCKADNFFQSSCWNFNLDLIVSGFLLFVNIPTSSLWCYLWAEPYQVLKIPSQMKIFFYCISLVWKEPNWPDIIKDLTLKFDPSLHGFASLGSAFWTLKQETFFSF